MKIVVAPDKFKGSLPAAQVAAAIAAGLRSGLARAGCPGAEVVTIPVADGGEGTVDATGRGGAAGRRGIDVVAVAGRSTLTAAELAAAGIAAVYPLSDLEPDLERCRAEAAGLLRRVGQMIARDRLAEAVTKAETRA
jgi:glycerate kinase